ncbi:hypothetical protein GCM10009839_33480 [Catenulispora yoronensis]|uniref:Uncharacterized protein n=1 Tax=Catenulispora yoronensis TaxID=450799 RepID=A0ABN2U7M4_9ACTN
MQCQSAHGSGRGFSPYGRDAQPEMLCLDQVEVAQRRPDRGRLSAKQQRPAPRFCGVPGAVRERLGADYLAECLGSPSS